MGFLGKLSEYTQRNIAKREENMKNTEENKMKAKENIPTSRRKPFSPTRLRNG